MTRSPKIGTFWGSDLRVHGSWAFMVPGVLGYSLYAYSWQAALFFLLLLLATSTCVLLHEWAHVLMAKQFGIGTRDITLYPLWGVARLNQIGERPWQENYIALVGPFAHLVLAGLLAVGLLTSGCGLAFHPENNTYDVVLFGTHLFWVNILLALANFLPILPLDGGTLFRASLAMTTNRLRATEVATILSTAGAGALLLLAIFWWHSLLIGFTAILIYFAAQEEVQTTRFFASLTTNALEEISNSSQPMMAPAEQLLSAPCQPSEPHFSGFTWNPTLRLWIEWRNGEAIRANALMGD